MLRVARILNARSDFFQCKNHYALHRTHNESYCGKSIAAVVQESQSRIQNKALRFQAKKAGMLNVRCESSLRQPNTTSTLDRVKILMRSSRLTHIAHDIWSLVLKPGDIVCDATAGNGHDSLFLAEKIGPSGHLVCIDIQEKAIKSTQEKIESSIPEKLRPQISYFVGCHSDIQNHVGSNIAKLVCFNLGYLPLGDKNIVTRQDSTISAIEGALECVCFGGLISCMCYTGHPGGEEEYESVKAFVSELSPRHWVTSEIRMMNLATAPILVLIWKRGET